MEMVKRDMRSDRRETRTYFDDLKVRECCWCDLTNFWKLPQKLAILYCTENVLHKCTGLHFCNTSSSTSKGLRQVQTFDQIRHASWSQFRVPFQNCSPGCNLIANFLKRILLDCIFCPKIKAIRENSWEYSSSNQLFLIFPVSHITPYWQQLPVRSREPILHVCKARLVIIDNRGFTMEVAPEEKLSENSPNRTIHRIQFNFSSVHPPVTKYHSRKKLFFRAHRSFDISRDSSWKFKLLLEIRNLLFRKRSLSWN